MEYREKKDLKGGLYLVADPSVQRTELLYKLNEALLGGVNIIQIWNNWPDSFGESDKEELVSDILELAEMFDRPVLINEEWELLKTTRLDGVHFDTVPEQIEEIRAEIQRDFIMGITCSNDLDIIRWADQHKADYISFCSMFPSSSVVSCEIVDSQTVKKAREITDLPLFASGGITTENLPELGELPISGVAIISGILRSDSPRQKTEDYKQIFQHLTTKS